MPTDDPLFQERRYPSRDESIRPPDGTESIPYVLPVEPNVALPASLALRPHPGFWFSVVWCLVFLVVTQLIPAVVIMIIVMVVFVGTSPDPREAMRELGRPEGLEQLQDMALAPSLAAAEVLVVGISLAIIRLIIGRDWKRHLALRRPAVHHVLLSLLVLPAMMLLSGAVYEALKDRIWSFKELGLPPIEDMMKRFAVWPVWFAVLVIGVGPGIGEELFCRGFLGRGLVGRYRFIGGVLLTSMFFGALHMDPPHAIAAGLMGIILHFTYVTTRSLWVPMTLHFLNNSLGVLASSKQFPDLAELDRLDKVSTANPLIFVAASFFLLVAVGWALYQGRSRLVAIADDKSAWHPPYPGVGYPPPGSGTIVVHPWPNRWALALVAVALVVFMSVIAQALMRP